MPSNATWSGGTCRAISSALRTISSSVPVTLPSRVMCGAKRGPPCAAARSSMIAAKASRGAPSGVNQSEYVPVLMLPPHAPADRTNRAHGVRYRHEHAPSVPEGTAVSLDPAYRGCRRMTPGAYAMTPQQTVLVQESFEQLAPISRAAAYLFYERLFELDPSLRPLFSGDIHEQGRKLMQILAVAVNGLDRLEPLAPALEELGRNHVAYGVVAEHY